MRTTEDHREKLFELEKDCDGPDSITELFVSKLITSIKEKKLHDKLMKKTDVPRTTEQIQQNTYDTIKSIPYRKHLNQKEKNGKLN